MDNQKRLSFFEWNFGIIMLFYKTYEKKIRNFLTFFLANDMVIW